MSHTVSSRRTFLEQLSSTLNPVLGEYGPLRPLQDLYLIGSNIQTLGEVHYAIRAKWDRPRDGDAIILEALLVLDHRAASTYELLLAEQDEIKLAAGHPLKFFQQPKRNDGKMPRWNVTYVAPRPFRLANPNERQEAHIWARDAMQNLVRSTAHLIPPSR